MARKRQQKQKHTCEHCWASTPVTTTKIFCMFPSCPYMREADPFGQKRAAKSRMRPAPPSESVIGQINEDEERRS